jgi:hypothetical protein
MISGSYSVTSVWSGLWVCSIFLACVWLVQVAFVNFTSWVSVESVRLYVMHLVCLLCYVNNSLNVS